MPLKHFKESPLNTSDSGEITGVEDEGGIKTKNIDHNSTDKKGFKDILDSDRCSVSGEEKSKYSRKQTISYCKGDKKRDEKSQGNSNNWCFLMSSSIVVITIFCFITGSYIAVRTKTNTDYISLTGL